MYMEKAGLLLEKTIYKCTRVRQLVVSVVSLSGYDSSGLGKQGSATLLWFGLVA